MPFSNCDVLRRSLSIRCALWLFHKGPDWLGQNQIGNIGELLIQNTTKSLHSYPFVSRLWPCENMLCKEPSRQLDYSQPLQTAEWSQQELPSSLSFTCEADPSSSGLAALPSHLSQWRWCRLRELTRSHPCLCKRLLGQGNLNLYLSCLIHLTRWLMWSRQELFSNFFGKYVPDHEPHRLLGTADIYSVLCSVSVEQTCSHSLSCTQSTIRCT